MPSWLSYALPVSHLPTHPFRHLFPFPMSFTRLVAVACLVFLFGSTALAQDLWSDPATWPSGTMPQSGDMVTIPMGQTVLLDVNPPALGGIRIMGTLRFAEVPLHVTTDWIIVAGGHLQIGTSTAPHTNPARITLSGADEDVLGMGMGGKMIAVSNGGLLDLHGSRKDDLSWTVLDQTAQAGDTLLYLRDAATWRVGDEIVLAPSGADPLETERLTVQNVSGLWVTVQPPLSFRHHGETETYDGKLLDMRAEIGLLTRNIVIEGDLASDTARFGGHVMVGLGGDGFVEGVEFRRMGQLGRQGRYPMHWHLSGSQYDNYARFNSVHDSYHRAFVIHGTDGITLEGNVAFNITSHAFVVAEDGDEEDNVIRNNLGILIHKIPRQEDYAFPSTSIVGGSAQSEHRPGIFWMKNPNHLFEGNHAAGSVDGIGFFFDGVGTATTLADGFFRNNTAHSNWSFFSPESNERYPPRTRGHGLFIRNDEVPGHTLHFESFTSYMNTLSGIWMEEVGQTASDLVLADNGTAAILMRADLQDAAVIYRSNNTSPPPAEDFGAFNTLTGFGKKKEHAIENIAFFGYDQPLINYEDSIIGPGMSVSNIRTQGVTGPRVFFNQPEVKGAIRDEDGSLTGMGPSLVFHESFGFANTPDCVHQNPNNTRTCPMEDFVLVRFQSEIGASAGIGPVSAQRKGAGGGSASFFSYENNAPFTQYQYLPANGRYRIDFEAPPAGSMPALYALDISGEQSGYTALRIPLADGFYRYVIDEQDNPLVPVATFADLQLDQTNCFVDLAANQMYLVVRLDAANGYKAHFNLFRVPENAVVRSAQAGSLSNTTVYPSSTRGTSTVRFEQGEDGPVHFALWDMAGRELPVGFQETLAKGVHQRQIDASAFPAGTYGWRLTTSTGSTSGRLVRID